MVKNHANRISTDCELTSDAATDFFIRIMIDATVIRYRACRLCLRMQVLLQWAAYRRAAFRNQSSQASDITRLHRIDAHIQTVSHQPRAEVCGRGRPIPVSRQHSLDSAGDLSTTLWSELPLLLA